MPSAPRLTTIERRGVALPAFADAPTSVPAYVAAACARFADRTFLVTGDERLTFDEVHAAAERVARLLVAGHGVRPGDRVGIAMRNSPAWIVLYLAVLRAGGTATLLNSWWRAGELADAVAEVGCLLVFADAERAARLSAGRVVTVNAAQPLAAVVAALGEDADAALPSLGPDDPATILFTSGSTGRCKGALSDHRAKVQAAYAFLHRAREPDGVQPATLLNLPLFHVTGEVKLLLQSFGLGRKLVLMERWDVGAALRLIERERVTHVSGVPLMTGDLLAHPDRGARDLSSVAAWSAGGAAQPSARVRRIADALGPPQLGYGLTETNALGAANGGAAYLAKPGATGRAQAPLVELRIIDVAGAPLPAGVAGEIAIRSVVAMTGYWGRPEESAAAFTADGWLRTGDLGYLDADGDLVIVDRIKDLVIRGGENVSCLEVEDALCRHPAVAEAAVFALPDPRWGEVPGAVVGVREAVDEGQLLDFLRDRIAGFKVPARLWIVSGALPKLGSGKVDKPTLRARYRALHAAGQAAA